VCVCVQPLHMEEGLEPIPFAKAEVFRHTMTRGAQVGVIGSWLLVPPLAYWRGVRGVGLASAAFKTSVVGCLAGAGFLAVGTYQKLEGDEPYAVYDRAYRLRNNRGQLKLDELSYAGSAVGVFTGTVLLGQGFLGFAVGLASGLGVGVVTYAGGRALGLVKYEE
jgi:hypothetical protein